MIVLLKRNSGVEYARVRVGESSKRVRKFMGEDTVTLEFSVPEPISFQVGDIITIGEETFTLNTIPQVAKEGHRRFTYTAVFESTMYDLGKVMYLLFTDDPVSPEPLGSFDLEGTAQTFADEIITNLNRVFSGWSLSGALPSTEYRNLYFEGETCLAALHKVCEEFGLEFTISGKVITIGFDLGTSHSTYFAYGRGYGLYNLRRVNVDSKEVITRLYAFGSANNLPADYRNYSPRLKLAADYVEANVATYGVIEHTEIFEDIFPTREGTVSFVNPGDEKVFRDSAMDFDLNDYLLNGLTAKIHFRTGLLAGYSFELNSYNHTDKEFAININKDEKDFEVPSSTLKPAVGDKYVLLDIKMPQSYIDAAETALAARAQDFINKYSNPQVAYELSLDPLYLERNPITVAPGDWVKVDDADIAVLEDVRMIGITYPIMYPNRLEVDLSENPTPSIEQLMFREQQELAALKSSGNAKAVSLSMIMTELTKLKPMLSMFELMNDGETDYIQAKLNLFGTYGITAYASADPLVPSIWDDMPKAAYDNTPKPPLGGIIVGDGLEIDEFGVLSVTGFSPTQHDLITSHTIAGLTAGHYLKALSATTFGFTAIAASDITGGGTLALGANSITMSGSIGVTGTRVLKGWFTDLEVTNAIAGSITGNAATATSATTAGTVTTAAQPNITSLGTLTALQVDNININGNVISSTTSGNVELKPLAGNGVLLDDFWKFDGVNLTILGDYNAVLTAYTGKNITIESVTFDGGTVGGITSLGTTGSRITNGYFTDIALTNPLSVSNGGTGSSLMITTGSVLFTMANGVLTGDSANLFYDNANNRLGIGTNAPATALHLYGGTIRLTETVGDYYWDIRTYPDDGYLQFSFGGSEKVVIKDNGAVGIGTPIPEAYYDSGDNFVIYENGNAGMTIASAASGYGSLWFADGTTGGAEYRGGVVYAHVSGGATERLYLTSGGAEALSILANGKVGIGTSTPDSYSDYADNLVVYKNGNAGITIATSTTGYGSLFFADGTTGSALYSGSIQYDHTNNILAIGTNGADRVWINSSGNVSIGTNSPEAWGRLQVNIADSDDAVLIKNTDATSSTSAIFRIDNTSSYTNYFRVQRDGVVGIGLGAAGAAVLESSSTRGIHIHNTAAASTEVRLTNNNSGSAATDGATLQLGSTSILYLWNKENQSIKFGTNNTERMVLSSTGSLTVTGEVEAYDTSDIRLKENITPLRSALATIDFFNPVTFNWNDIAKGLNSNKDDRNNFGLIAQELEQVLPELIHPMYGKYKGIDYVQLIPILIGAIKELKNEIEILKS